MPTIKPNKAEEIIGEIFRDQKMIFGLKEFDGIDFAQAVYISEGEKGRFYIKDHKNGQDRFVFDVMFSMKYLN